MELKIIDRKSIHKIDINDWHRLSEESTYPNPFYEPFILIPALKHLSINRHIKVVCAYKDDCLFALFPIEIIKHKLGFRYISIWKSSECFLCDPLCTNTQGLTLIISRLLRKLQIKILRIDDHSAYSFGRYLDQNSVVFEYERGSVLNTNNVNVDLNNLSRKVRLENKRIKKRFYEKTNAVYLTSKKMPDINWLDEYCQLEHSGWKKTVKGSILSQPNTYAYFKALCEEGEKQGTISYQGLFIKSENETEKNQNNFESLAISIRVSTHKKAFELKTCYSETFKKYYPGVNLELANLNDDELLNFDFVDSCAQPDNSLINRIWPSQRKIYSSIYFHRGILGYILKRVYRFKNRKYL